MRRVQTRDEEARAARQAGAGAPTLWRRGERRRSSSSSNTTTTTTTTRHQLDENAFELLLEPDKDLDELVQEAAPAPLRAAAA